VTIVKNWMLQHTGDPRGQAEIQSTRLPSGHEPVREPERRFRLAAAHNVFNYINARYGLWRSDDLLLKWTRRFAV